MESLSDSLRNDFFSQKKIKERLDQFKNDVAKGRMSPFKAAEELLKLYKI